MSPNRLWHSFAATLLALSALAIGFGAPSLGASGNRKEDLPPYHSAFPMPEPKLFGDGLISTGDFESHPAFTPDGRTLYFVKSTPSDRFRTILYSRFVDGGWTVPATASFSGKYTDTDPFITPDGTKLYYASNRAADDYIGSEPRDNMDLWVVERAGDTTWFQPKSLGPAVNSPSDEWSPSLAADGTVYFASERAGGRGKSDLWRCRLVNGAYGAAENLGDSVNTAGSELDVLIAADQSWILFTADGRSDGRGGSDLYVCRARAGGWSSPRNLGDKINSRANECSPLLSPDGEYFFWTSCRSFADGPFPHQLPYFEQALTYPQLLAALRRPRNGGGDLYQIDRSALGLHP